MSEQMIPEWMTYEAVGHIAATAYPATPDEAADLAAEVLRAWDLLETQANEIFALKNRLAG